MSIVPNTNIGKLTFYEAHIPGWTTNAVQLGLTSGDCTALDSLVKASRTAFDNQQLALDAAKSASGIMRTAIAAMHALGATDIAKIKAFAESTGNPDVYFKANIPAPATPAPVGPPGTPTDFTVSLNQSGAVTLRWKCANPPGAAGTIYQVRRKIGSGAFVSFDGVGKRTFTDATIPAGSTGVMYEITATRSTIRGEPAMFNVNFGIGGDGMMIASVTEVATPLANMKLAA